MESTLPYSWYTDPEVLRREQERIFRARLAVRRPPRAAPGAGHVLHDEAPAARPIVVTRAKDGELRAFLNVCRHRGFPVAEGEGKRETIQCPYHAWTYGLDGSLRSRAAVGRGAGLSDRASSASAPWLPTRGARSCS